MNEASPDIATLARASGFELDSGKRSVVCVQGLGFVGSAMALAVASARTKAGDPVFTVVGVDLPTERGRAVVDSLNDGVFPFQSEDPALDAALETARGAGNFIATTDPAAYAFADVVVVDVNLDIEGTPDSPNVDFSAFRQAIAQVGDAMRPGSLIVVETTVPPGTCATVVAPLLRERLKARGLPADAFLLAHSYERIMPGKDYFSSIVNYWRVYAGLTDASADACRRFLSTVVNVDDYPLTRLPSTTASETAKVLENSYRAVNIAFIEEWSRFAESVGVDLFEIVAAIRQRPTHANIRQPGFGVGGYCLTKDPLFADFAARELFGRRDLGFPFSRLAVEVNAAMPLQSLNLLKGLLGGDLAGKSILLMGVSYREGVADTRFAPSETFVRAARKEGAQVAFHDPLVRHWREMSSAVPAAVPGPDGFDAVVFAVAHREYGALDVAAWLGSARPAILDANGVLGPAQRAALGKIGVRMECIGRGTAP